MEYFRSLVATKSTGDLILLFLRSKQTLFLQNSSSFQTAAELAMQGFNCSLIACGAAATGKSFSIFGRYGM